MRCTQCGFIYVQAIEDDHAIISDGPVLLGRDARLLNSANLDDLRECWEADLLPDKEREWPALRIDAAAALARIERYVAPPGRLLDFGCGWGFFLDSARERGWEPYGIEPLVGSAIHARGRFGATVVADILRADTFPADSFNVITAFQVFEHIPRPRQVLGLLHKILRPGGVLLIEVPNIDTWSVRLLKRQHRHFVEDHVNFFSTRTLTALLAAQGFEVLESYFPKRHLTVGHLVSDWGRRYLRFLPSPPARIAKSVVPVNVGDIVAVIARRMETSLRLPGR